MGSRSAAETVIAIVSAFVDHHTWTQAGLAKHVGIGVPALRKHLEELSRHIPLESERDHPHVTWSLPLNWFPGGITIPSVHATELVRQLARAPQSNERDELLLAVTTASRTPTPTGVTALATSDAHLRLIEDCCNARTTLSMAYYSAHSGHIDRRKVSVQRVLVGPFHRFVAHCHRTDELRVFRVSRIHAADLDTEAYRQLPRSEVDAFISTCVDGFRDPSAPIHVAFTVRDPEARWVKDTLPVPMDTEPAHPDGIRASAKTAGIRSLARFVVGLGEAARAETPELIAAVHELAQGSLTTHSPPIRSVELNDSTSSKKQLP